MASAGQPIKLRQPKDSTDPFNKSGITARSPPSEGIMSQNSKQHESKTRPQMRPEYHTKSLDVACSACEINDEHTKLKCFTCQRWWHLQCQKGHEFTANKINEGKWKCLNCLKPNTFTSPPIANFRGFTSSHLNDDGEITRIELDDTVVNGKPREKHLQSTMLPPVNLDAPPKGTPGGPLNIPPIIPTSSNADKTKEHQSLRSIESKKKTVKTHESRRTNREVSEKLLAEKLAIIDKKKEWMKKKILLDAEEKLLEAEMECYREKEKALSQSSRSSRSSRTSSRSEIIVEEEERRQSIEKCQEWVGSAQLAANKSSIRPVINSVPQGEATLRFLNPDMTIDQFLDSTLRGANDHVVNRLSKDQMRARKTLSRDLPTFTGHPKDWPYFISKFRDTTQMCGFSEIENLDRLQKCLKGDALESVKCDLMTTKSLASVLSTLKLLYGKPTSIFNALVEEIRKSPPVKAEKMETLVVYAMKVKNLSATMLAASMETYLNNPSLLSETTTLFEDDVG